MQARKWLPSQWDSKCQQALNDLKRLCTTAPILAYADFTKLFKVFTLMPVALGLEAVLYQTHMSMAQML